MLKRLLTCLILLFAGSTAIWGQSEAESANSLEIQNLQGRRKALISVGKLIKVHPVPSEGLGTVKGTVEQVTDSTIVVSGTAFPISKVSSFTLRHEGVATIGCISLVLGLATYVFFVLLNRGLIDLGLQINTVGRAILFLLGLLLLFVMAVALIPWGVVLLLLSRKNLQMSRSLWRVIKGSPSRPPRP